MRLASAGETARRPARLFTAVFAAIAAIASFTLGAQAAFADTRALDIYHTHTGEHEVITFKRDGVYDQQGLAELNHILRDWRRNETIRMDPALFDLIWEVYRDAGAKGPIQIVCGYRSPETNNMLRERSRGVAKFSQHTLGKAMDFYLPGVPLEKLREVGMKKQIGGVGFYPTSGSPFVHMDTGGVRAWPRMSREQLVRLFPDGRTLHRPSDGPDLPGYNQAVADYQRGRPASQTQMADAGAPSRSRNGGNVLSALFGMKSGEDDEVETAPVQSPPPAHVPPKPAVPSKDTIVAAAALPEVAPPRSNAPLPAPQPLKSPLMPNLPHLAAKPIDEDVGPIRDPAATQAPPLVMASLPMPPSRPAGAVGATSGASGPSIAQLPQAAASQAAIASLKPINVPLPTTKPIGTAGTAPRPRPQIASASIGSRPIDEAFSALTGTPQAPRPEALLGYAPTLVAAEMPEGRATSVARDGSARLKLAALGPADTAAIAPPAAGTLAKQARVAPDAAAKADVLPKADRADPMAHLVSHATDITDSRFFTPISGQRFAAIATLAHPDQDMVPLMVVKPTEVLAEGFNRHDPPLAVDRFTGPAIVALAVITTR